MSKQKCDALEIKFWERVQKTDDCWNWTGGTAHGYGRLHVKTIKGKKHRHSAHRYSYEIHVGPIPSGMHVLHTCDNPACVNPAHLFIGTQADNDADRDAKGRQAYGVRNGQSKLTAKMVRELRKLREQGLTYKVLGRRFGISLNQARRVAIGVDWKHVV